MHAQCNNCMWDSSVAGPRQRTRLFSKTTCSYTCVTSWQYSFYNTIARLIHIVFKFAIVSCTCIVAAIATFYKLYFINFIVFVTLYYSLQLGLTTEFIL